MDKTGIELEEAVEILVRTIEPVAERVEVALP